MAEINGTLPPQSIVASQNYVAYRCDYRCAGERQNAAGHLGRKIEAHHPGVNQNRQG